MYQLVVKESSVSSWGSASVYMIELFADGNVVDTLYLSNSTAASGTVEGVTAKFDLGSGDLPDAISYKVQMVAN